MVKHYFRKVVTWVRFPPSAQANEVRRQDMKRQFKTRQKSFTVRRVERKSRWKFFLTVIVAGALIYSMFAWFLPTFIGGLSILNRFKSAPRLSDNIADHTTLAPPVLNIPYEATNTAFIKINGYSQPGSEVEIYLDDDLKTTVEVLAGNFTSEEIPLSVGTNNIWGKTVDEQGNRSLASKTIRIIYSNEKPKLDLKEPQDNQIITGDKKVTVSGSVDADKEITVTVNGIRLIVNTTGNFSQKIDLNEGDNNLVIIAADSLGNSTQITRKVTYNPQ